MLYYKSTTLFACGKRGIRTLGTVARTTVFETVPFGHSGIFPKSDCKDNVFTCQRASFVSFFCRIIEKVQQND